jgi:hypothetical protein
MQRSFYKLNSCLTIEQDWEYVVFALQKNFSRLAITTTTTTTKET